jgi:hypothetical protein
MNAFLRTLPIRPPARALASATFAAGVVGMGISFLFLASAHPLDVLAGAAGFIAGSVLVAAGLVSIALRPVPATTRAESGRPLNLERWLAHFRANRNNRPEPDWAAPRTLPDHAVQPLVRSLEQFQLGDGGGPAYLIAHDRERFLAMPGVRALVDHWFAEEREHARLLAAAVARFGGRCIQNHWSFTAFCLTRKWGGVRFELTVLLLTEIVSTVYYRLLRRHASDPPLRAMCGLILRDEIGHVSFHRDRLARSRRGWGPMWAARFRLLGLTAATVLWVNHAPGLRAVGATTREFYREVWRELSRFIGRLRREAASCR